MEMSIHNGLGLRKYLTQDEILLFLRSSSQRDSHVDAFCWILVYTGCRISEGLSLTKTSIDTRGQSVIIECLKKRKGGIFRSVPVPRDLLSMLEPILSKMTLGTERIWPWSRMTAYRRICEIMEEAGIRGEHASPKGLRHSFGVRAIQAGVPLHLVQRWLGHADMKTTAIYTSALGPEEREIASRMWATGAGSHRNPRDAPLIEPIQLPVGSATGGSAQVSPSNISVYYQRHSEIGAMQRRANSLTEYEFRNAANYHLPADTLLSILSHSSPHTVIALNKSLTSRQIVQYD